LLSEPELPAGHAVADDVTATAERQAQAGRSPPRGAKRRYLTGIAVAVAPLKRAWCKKSTVTAC